MSAERDKFSPPPPPYPASKPPAVLYHAVPAGEVDEVLHRGLLPTNRPHVHLTWKPEHARSAVGEDASPVLFEVDAEALHDGGTLFYVSPKGTWLVDRVPTGFLTKVD